ncbi:MAG: phage holin family protein [Deltaproteobacteria bacterium]|nr:phage holin family protein [Deltaproteobacteria bacterium]
MYFLIKWLVLTMAVMIASYLVEGIHVSGFFSAFFTAAVLGMLNVFFRPVLLILTLPLNILSFGLFTFVINAIMLMMASGIIPGFQIQGFWSAVVGSFIISAVNWIITFLIIIQQERETRNLIDLNKDDDNIWK